MVIQTSRQRLKNNMQNAKDKNNYVWWQDCGFIENFFHLLKSAVVKPKAEKQKLYNETSCCFKTWQNFLALHWMITMCQELF